MPIPEIEQFAALLVRKVRDGAVAQCDSNLHPDAQSPVAERWKATREKGDTAALASELVADVVDSALCELLRAIDNGLLKLSFTAEGGRVIDLPRAGRGELVGWYLGQWRSQYSKERFVDDFADLA